MITSEQLALLHKLVDNGGRIVGVADLSPEELRLADDEKRIAVGHGFGIAWIPSPKQVSGVGLTCDELAEASREPGLHERRVTHVSLNGDGSLGLGWVEPAPEPVKPAESPGLTVAERFAESIRRQAKAVDDLAARMDDLASDARDAAAKAVGLIASLATTPGQPSQVPEIRMVEVEIRMVEVYDVAAEACATWGPTAQATMIVEEVGEFLTAFARLSRNRATREQVIEEAADVIVVLGSALVLVGGRGNETLALLAKAVEDKVARLRERLLRANT